MSLNNNSKNQQSDQSSISDLWLIKLESEQVKGPFTTEAICKMILEGIYSGQEYVARYPEGDWRPVSKQAEFYETLLESLENPIERDEKQAQKMDAETVIRISAIEDFKNEQDEKLDSTQAINAEFSSELQKLLKANSPVQENLEPNSSIKKNNHETVLTSLKEKQQIQFNFEKEKITNQRKEQIKKLIPFAIGLILILGSILVYNNYFNYSNQHLWLLKTPDFKKENIDALEAKKLKVKAISYIKTGVIDDYLKAQDLLVQAVEGQKNDVESLGLLCVVYNSLWPYTKQLSNDLKAVAAVYKQIRLANPLSSHTESCQGIYLLIKGQSNDGRAIIEKVLDQNTESAFILYPFLYFIKGQTLEEVGSLINAESYYAEALKQFPGWTMAEYYFARAQYKQNKYIESAQSFEKIIKRQPQFKAGLFGLALNQSKLKNSKVAFNLFEKSYDIKQTVPKDLLLESLQEYANELAEMRENKKALEVVQAGLKISPTHRALKDLFISLGGENLTIESSQVTELIIEGDQFFRLGDFLAAQGRYRAAFDNDKKNSMLAIKIAKSLKALNLFKDSILWIDQALKIDPKLFPAYSLKADYYLQRFNYVDAESTLQAAQKIDPQNYEILKGLSRLEWKKNNLYQALLIGEKAYKQYNVDVELLTLLANINIDLYFKPTKSITNEADKEKTNALDNAQKYSTKAIDLEPAWPESQITYSKYIQAKDGSQKSEKYYLELIKSYPYTIDYRIALAEFYEQQDKINSALEIYQRLNELNLKDTKANKGLARCYRMKNEYTQAIKHYMIGISLDPSDVEPMFAIAQLQFEMGQAESNSQKANKLLNDALSRFESVKKNNIHFPKIYYFAAKVKLALGLYDEALLDINTEKTKNPNLADPYILSAELSQKQGQFIQCAKDYAIVIKLRPASDYYFKAAACQRLAGALDIAEELINDGHTIETGNYNYFRELGYLYEAKGEKELARKNFQDYLILTAHNSVDAKEIESKLTALGF